MARLTITVPDTLLTRVLDAVGATYGYTPDDGTLRQFATSQLARHLRDVVQGYEVAQASADAAQAAADQAAADLSGIG